MNPVKRMDDRLAELDKPALVSVREVVVSSGGVLVLCAGFEDRATAILGDVVRSTNSASIKAALIEYDPRIPQNRTEEMRALCESAGIKILPFRYPREDRSGIGREIVERIGKIAGEIVIDVSAMSRLLITQLMVALSETRRGFRDTKVAYAEAAQYPPGKDDVDEAQRKSEEELSLAETFISYGVFDLSIVPELSAVALQGEPIRSVVFPSFNTYQLAALRSEIQPSRFSVINGVPPGEENRWRTEVIRRLNRIDELPRCDEYRASTLDYRETLARLVEIYGKHGEMEKIVLSPTGSKMQAVGSGLFRSFMKDVQVVYPTPLKYAPPEKVTVGIGKKYVLDLGSFSELL